MAGPTDYDLIAERYAAEIDERPGMRFTSARQRLRSCLMADAGRSFAAS